jgi:hypothetical protein
MLFLQASVYSEVEARETVALTQALRAVTVSENVLADRMQATVEHYKSIHAWDDYETACGRDRLEVERRHGIVVAKCLKEFDARCAPNRELAPIVPYVCHKPASRGEAAAIALELFR